MTVEACNLGVRLNKRLAPTERSSSLGQNTRKATTDKERLPKVAKQ